MYEIQIFETNTFRPRYTESCRARCRGVISSLGNVYLIAVQMSMPKITQTGLLCTWRHGMDDLILLKCYLSTAQRSMLLVITATLHCTRRHKRDTLMSSGYYWNTARIPVYLTETAIGPRLYNYCPNVGQSLQVCSVTLLASR